MTARQRWLALGVLWLAVVAWLTLRSAPDQVARVADLKWSCIVCGDGGAADVLLNVLLFIPLGLVAHALGVQFRWAVAAALLLSAGIETCQGLLLVGRDAALGDVLSNAAGAAVGWGAYSLLRRLARPTRALAGWGVVVALIVSSAVWFGTGLGLRPALTDAAPWVGQVLHRWPGNTPFPGTVQRIAIDGIDVPNDPLASLPSWRDSLVVDLVVTRSAGERPGRRISIARVVDARGRVQLSISESGDNLVIEVRLRATAWRLHTPDWVFENAAAIEPGQRWHFRFRFAPDLVELTSAPDGAPATTRSATRLVSIGMGWVFIHPFVTAVGARAAWWTLLWLGWWFGLVGWLGGAVDRRVAVGAIALQCIAMVGAAALTGVPWRGFELLAGVGIASAAAAMAGRRRRRGGRAAS